MEKSIIVGEISRISKYGKAVDFNVYVSLTLIKGQEFTIRTNVSCTVREYVSTPGTDTPLQKPFKTACCLAVGDKVKVTLQKEKDKWEVIAISYAPKKSQEVGEFLADLEKIVEQRRIKATYPQH